MALSKEAEEWVEATMKAETDNVKAKADYEVAVAALADVEARQQADVDAAQLQANAAINAVTSSYAVELAAKREAVATAKGKIKIEAVKP